MSRYFAFFALLAIATAFPASDDFPRPITTITESDFEDSSPWFRFPPLGNIFGPLTKLFSNFADMGPKIIANDKKLRVIVNVKEYKKEDLKVKVKNDFIQVQGAHEAKHDDHDLFASQFFHTYTLPENCSASDVTATLSSDGYLDVVAPINGAGENNKVDEREVPIIESGKPLQEETEQDTSEDKIENTRKTDNVNNIENNDKIETLDTPVEPAKVENIDKAETLDAPVEPIAQVENVGQPETLDTPAEPVAKVENINKVETVNTPENVGQPETLDAPSEPIAKAETIETPVEPITKIENVDNAKNLETPVEPLAVDKVEQPQPAEVAIEDKKEATTPSPDREEVTDVAIDDIKVPQDNEVNEIQP